MNCHMCGQREATVHLLELVNGQRKSVWLCPLCASGRTDLSADPRLDRSIDDESVLEGEPGSLAAFLGHAVEPEASKIEMAACPSCGYEFKRFQANNRLGCSQCYPHFRAQVLPILARYHRHAHHLGKVPRQAGGRASRQGEITRIRVALEKAIQGENYEEAARLRDMMRHQIAERDRLSDNSGSGGDSP